MGRLADVQEPEELWVSGPLRLFAGSADVEVARGMAVVARDEREAGYVAAVALDRVTGQVTFLLLACPRQKLEYRIVPASLIEEVRGEAVMLALEGALLDELVVWRGHEK